jgi:hypothetical protein
MRIKTVKRRHYEDGKGLARRHNRQAPAGVIVKHRVSV